MTGLNCSRTTRTGSSAVERLPGAREERVVRPAAVGQVQPQAGSALGSERREDVGHAGRRAALRSVRAPTNSENCRPRPARSGALPTSRCQRAKSPRYVRPMLPVPEPADRDAGPRPVVDHRQVDPRPRRRLGSRRRAAATSAAAGMLASGRHADRLLLDAGDDDAAHERALGEEEDRRPGTAIVMQRGGLDQRRLGRRTARCTAGSPIDSGWSSGLLREVQQRHEEVVPGEEEVEQRRPR